MIGRIFSGEAAMQCKISYSFLFSLVVIALVITNPVYAEDVPSDSDDTAGSSESNGNDFDSREGLTEYLSAGAQEEQQATQQEIDALNEQLISANEGNEEAEQALTRLDTAQQKLAEGQEELAAAQSDEEISAAESKIDEAEMEIEQARGDLIAANPENEQLLSDLDGAKSNLEALAATSEEIAEIVGNMSDEQVYWTNQKLQNAKSSGLQLNIPLEDLEKFTDYNFHQVNAVTKAFESEARFNQLAMKFDEDSKQREMFEDRAALQRDKFLAKSDRFDSEKFDGKRIKSEAAQTAKEQIKAGAKSNIANTARNAAKNEAKLAAKNTAKDVSKREAKQAAKLAAKDAALAAAKNSAKQTAKQVVQEEGRSAGKALGREKAKENGKNAGKGKGKGKGNPNA